MHAITIGEKKLALYSKESKRDFMVGFGGRKGNAVIIL